MHFATLTTREKIALTCSVAILALAAWFWSGQIQDVLALLALVGD